MRHYPLSPARRCQGRQHAMFVLGASFALIHRKDPAHRSLFQSAQGRSNSDSPEAHGTVMSRRWVLTCESGTLSIVDFCVTSMHARMQWKQEWPPTGLALLEIPHVLRSTSRVARMMKNRLVKTMTLRATMLWWPEAPKQDSVLICVHLTRMKECTNIGKWPVRTIANALWSSGRCGNGS